MARLVKILVILAGVYVGVMAVSGIAIKLMLSSDASGLLREDLSRRFPVEVKLGRGEFDLVEWFLLRPSVSISEFSLGNPEGFSDNPMIEAGTILVRVDLKTLLSDVVTIREISIEKPLLRIETNAAGQSNLAALAPVQPAPEAGGGAAEGKGLALVVDNLSVNGGKLMLTDLASGDSISIEGVEIAVTGFSTEHGYRLHAAGRPFGGARSLVSFDGTAGPFLQTSFPAEGELKVVLAPAEVPPDYRAKHLGTGLQDPGPDSILRIESKVSGDLLKDLKGDGRLAFEDFEFGRDADHRLPVKGETPLKLRLRNALNHPALRLRAPDTAIRFGAGELRGALELTLGIGRTGAAINGAISGVDINQMLSAFTQTEDKIFGTLAIPDFELRTAGGNAGELLRSLNGKGSVVIKDGQLTLMNTIDTVVKTLEALLRAGGFGGSGGETAPGGAEPVPAEEGATSFTTLTTKLVVGNQRVSLTDIVMKSSPGDVTGAGYFTFDQEMNLDLVATVGGEIASALGGKPGKDGQVRKAIPFRVTGTLAEPVVRPDAGVLAVGTATGILDRLLGGDKKDEEGGQEGSLLDLFRKKK